MLNNAALIIMNWKRLELEIFKLLTKLSVKWLECIGTARYIHVLQYNFLTHFYYNNYIGATHSCIVIKGMANFSLKTLEISQILFSLFRAH